MKIKSKWKFVSLLIVALIAIGITAVKLYDPSPKRVAISAMPAILEGGLHDNLKKAEIKVVGKVVAAESERFNGGGIITNYPIEVVEPIKLKGELPKSIKVSLIGGVVDGTIYEMENQKLLNVGDTYLFFLNKRYPEQANSDLYWPAYYEKGIVKVKPQKDSQNIDYIAATFNPLNELEKGITGKNIKSSLSEDLN